MVVGVEPLETRIGEGVPSGCVGVMPSAASIVVLGGCIASRGGRPCKRNEPPDRRPCNTSPKAFA
eukprot:3291971-Alexandrium_andersonii.AAC.1